MLTKKWDPKEVQKETPTPKKMGKPKWKKGKKVQWNEDDEKGMSSWGEYSAADEQEAYEKESQK
eukprot:3121156-Karenia_brevis.AAC.1